MRSRRSAFLAIVLVGTLVAALAGPADAHRRKKSGDLVSRRHARIHRAADAQSQKMYEAVVDAEQLSILTEGGYDIASVEETEDGFLVTLVLYPNDVKALEKQGIELTLWRNDLGLTSTQLIAKQTSAGYKVWRDYDGPDGLRQYQYDLEAANEDLLDLEVTGMTHGTNPDGGPDTPREILAMRLTADEEASADGSKPAALYTANQHAREWISAEVDRRLLEWFIERYREGDPQIVSLLDSTELWFVLVANPDGYQYTFTPGHRLWRKNLRDNDGDDVITSADGVDPNRNFPEHWGYDEEGSASLGSDETYRGPSAGSEPETQAMIGLYDMIAAGPLGHEFAFQVNYHSFGRLLLYTQGWQVQTPSGDDPIYIALSGTDKKPAIQKFDPGVGADLYITNGETTDWAHNQRGTLAWTPELSEGPNGDGFVFPDSEGAVQGEFQRLLPFSLDVALSAGDPENPVSHLGLTTEPFYLDVSEFDPQKSHNPMSDFTFDYSYGDPQPVEILAKRSLGPVEVHWSVNGGATQTAATSDWGGGDRFGATGDDYYAIMRGEVTGFDVGDQVEVWFTGGGETSDSFTFEVMETSPADVLVLAAEDYSGPTNIPGYGPSGPHYLSYYTDALDNNGIDHDVYDVDAMNRTAPDNLGVLGHYDAVIWYTGNDVLTREPGQQPGTGASTLAFAEVLEVRSYLNEGGKLLHTGQWAGYEHAFGYEYNPVSTPPYCDGNVPKKTGVGCLFLSDDFYQYYLGAYLYIDDGGTDPDGHPYPVAGTDAPYAAAATDPWTLNGGDSADNQVHTASLLTTSSLLKPADFPQFTSTGPAEWDTGVSGAFEPHSPTHYVYSDRGDISYKRLMKTVSVPGGGGSLDFWMSRDTEPSWDFVFVEAHTPGMDDWVTLPAPGITSSDTGDSCPEGWHVLHPFLERYQGADCSGAGWNAASGRSSGWENWTVDLSAWAGSDVEVSISYVSDWAVQGLGVFVDDITEPDGTLTDFESGDGGWTAAGPAPGSAPNPNDWYVTESVGFTEGAVTSLDPPDASFRTLYAGFGFEGIDTQDARDEFMCLSMDYLGVAC